jgi:RHS repeat-associated protein
VYFTPNLLASGPSGPYTWFGTLAENGGGSTGMLFRRNRYFDPVSGRFTQQDPIGVAGGLNLYGFADGDPVNFADPFGLYPCCVGANAIVLGFAGTLKERRAEILTGLSKDDMVGVALSSTPAGAGARIGGQLHHVVSKAIGRAMSNAPRLRGALGEMRQRLVTRARDLMSHRGYQKWHRDLDKEVIEFIEQNPGVSPSRFERFLEERYAKPDLADKFPGGTRNP